MLNKKKVIIFSTAYFPFVGGAEVAVKEITDRIKEIEFVMITSLLRKDLKPQEKIGNIEVYRIGKGNKWDKFRLIFSGYKKARELGHFDFIWAIMASFGGFAALRLKKRLPEVPFLLTLQEGDSKAHIYSRVWFVWGWFKQIFKRADKIQAISSYLAKWAKEMGAKCEVEVVPNGVDLERFQISDLGFQIEHKKNVCSKLKVSGETKFVITVSRLVEKNGVGDLIKAMEFLPDDIHLLVVGEGELEKELKKQAGEKVHFIGKVEHGDLPKYLAASDVFCRPSLSEGLGNAFLEAMAAGLPVVGTEVGGIPDFLENEKTGLFCKARDAKDIAEKIKKILDDENLRKNLIENGSKLVNERYSWDLIAEKMKKIFETL